MCTSLIFSIFRVMCLSQQSVLKHFHDPPKETLCPLAVPVPSTSSLQPYATTCLLTVSIGFPVLEISYKWNHAVCSLLWLTSFHNIFKVYLCCSLNQYIIPFYDKIVFCVWIYHILFIHSSADGPLVLYFLTTMNNAVMNIPVQYVFILLRYVAENSIAGWYDNSMSNFLWICQTIFQSSYTIL